VQSVVSGFSAIGSVRLQPDASRYLLLYRNVTVVAWSTTSGFTN